MSKRKTKEQFISESILKHGNIYNYLKVIYKNNSTKVIITCPIHGDFEQTPYSHLHTKTPCNSCSRLLKTETNECFIKKAIDIHNGFYNYFKTDYIIQHKKVIITCPIHGDFEQTPNSHLNGRGCLKCSGKEKLSTDTFIDRASKIHKNKYDYSKVNYITMKIKIKIICPIHGEFAQRPDNHLQGRGCLKCNITNWDYIKLYQDNAELGSQPGIFYKLKFTHKELGFSFLKIGITRNTINYRYNKTVYKNYTYEIIEEIKCTNLESAILENKFIKETSMKKFIFPKNINKFPGHTECFSLAQLFFS